METTYGIRYRHPDDDCDCEPAAVCPDCDAEMTPGEVAHHGDGCHDCWAAEAATYGLVAVEGGAPGFCKCGAAVPEYVDTDKTGEAAPVPFERWVDLVRAGGVR